VAERFPAGSVRQTRGDFLQLFTFLFQVDNTWSGDCCLTPKRVTHSHAKWNAKREWVTQRRTSELLSHRLALITKLSDTFEKENLKEAISIRVSAVTKARERHALQRG